MLPERYPRHSELTVTIQEPDTADAAAVLGYLNRVGGETDFLTFGEEGFDLEAV